VITNPILDTALDYLRQGFCPVPIPPREKGPTNKGWPEEAQRITVENAHRYFKLDNNLGLLMGFAKLLDVDCDCVTAVNAARLLLPPTGFVYGRPSKPRSHYLYVASSGLPVNNKYVDPDGETIVEFRSLKKDGTCGLQTVVPPSVHRDTGEAIRLETDANGVPAVVDAVAVYGLVAQIAAAGLLAKHWPGAGRHAGELALAGALANPGMPEEDAVGFVLLTYQSVPTHDRSALSRVKTSVRDTYHKHEAEAEHTGFKTLAEAVGQDVAAKAMAWLGLNAPQASRGTRSNQASAGLLSMVNDSKIELFTAQDGRAYASYTRGDGIRDTAGLWTGEFQRYLTGLYVESEGLTIASERVKEVIAALEYEAFKNVQRNVHLRAGASEDGKTIYYDIGDGCNIVAITAEGWKVIASDAVDVRFRRPKGLSRNVLPVNVPDARERFRKLVNVENENDFVLLVSWLAGCFRPNGPYPILGVSSIQGSGKTTLTKMLRLIVDPNVSTLRPPPKDERDLAVSGQNNYVLVIDNVSFLHVWFADGLCRIATGTGFASRTLYANEDETVLQVCRPVILNGIEDFATRGDVVDRLVPISMRAISEETRRMRQKYGASLTRYGLGCSRGCLMRCRLGCETFCL